MTARIYPVAELPHHAAEYLLPGHLVKEAKLSDRERKALLRAIEEVEE